MIVEDIYKNLKDTLDIKFKFFLSTKNVARQFLNISFDILGEGKLNPQIKLVIDDLESKNMLSKNSVSYTEYRFNSKDIFYNFHLRSYGGDTFSRGFSFDINEAVAKALGEFLERDQTRFMNIETNIVHATLDDIIALSKSKSKSESEDENESENVNYLDINQFNKPIKAQMEKFKDRFYWDKDTMFEWVLATDFINDKQIYVPAQTACWSHISKYKEPYIFNTTSNGCGAGYSKEEAFKSAVFELVHRDAFFEYWYNNLSPDIIDQSTINSPKINNFLELLKNEGFEIKITDMTGKAKLPTACAFLKKESTGYYVGGSTSDTMEGAIYRAIEESFSIYMWQYERVRSGQYKIDEFVYEKYKNDFIDERLLPSERILFWASKFFGEDVMSHNKFMFEGKIIKYNNVSTGTDFDLGGFIKKSYKTCIIVNADKVIDYNYFYTKVLILPMYQLALDETLSLPIKDNIYPKNTYPHPFP